MVTSNELMMEIM